MISAIGVFKADVCGREGELVVVLFSSTLSPALTTCELTLMVVKYLFGARTIRHRSGNDLWRGNEIVPAP